MFEDLRKSLSLAGELARQHLAVQYRQSLLGVLQAFLPAIVTVAWCVMIRHAKIIDVPALETPYPAFVLISMMLWLTFVESLYAPIDALVSQQSLLKNSNAPCESIVLGRMGVVAFNFLVKLILIVLAAAWYQLPISFTAILAPVGVLLLMILGMSIGLLLAPFNFLYRDISTSLGPILTFWFFITPVFFPSPEIPPFSYIVAVNPVTPLLASTREWITLGGTTQLLGFFISAAFALLLLAASWTFYRMTAPIVVEYSDA